MPLYLFYTMVQKSQKWPKTQMIGGPALNFTLFQKYESTKLSTVRKFVTLQYNWYNFQDYSSLSLV